MKKDGKYRYTLQFGLQTDEEYQAGELLERLGNKKSAVIIAALNEYMISHPELQSPYCKIEVKVGSNFSQDRVEQIVRISLTKRWHCFSFRELPPRKLKKPQRRSKKMLLQCWITLICLDEMNL